MIYFLDACTNSSFLSIILFLKNVLEVICIIVPILLILMSSIDVGKIVLNPDPKNTKKATSMLVKRFLAAIGVFFVPTVVSLVLGLAGVASFKTTSCWINANTSTINAFRDVEEAQKQAELNEIQAKREKDEIERLIREAAREATREENAKKAQELAQQVSANSTKTSTPLASRLIGIAQKEADSHPPDSPNKYTRKYGNIGGRYDYGWCAAFVWWVSNEAGVYPVEVTKKSASVISYMSYFKSGDNGVRYENSKAYGGSYIPKMGDYIFFDWNQNPNDGDHIGLVKGISGDKVLIIDGNYSSTVKDRSMSLSSKDIIGYGVWE